jgi:hypothetical protein
MRKIVTLLCYCLAAVACRGADVDYWTPANVERFADYLYENGEYLRAAGEYRRLLFRAADDAAADRILFRIARCHRMGGSTNKAIRVFHDVVDEFPRTTFADKARCAIAATLTSAGDRRSSARHIEKALVHTGDIDARRGMMQVAGINRLLDEDWSGASTHFRAMGLWTDDPVTERLSVLAERAEALPRKKRWVAGAMSALVPGSGKAYAGRYADGVYSLALVGLTGWQAWEGFRRDGTQSVRGWIYGTIGGALYLGNVYGSVVAVEIYNDSLEEEILEGARAQVSLTCEY